MTAHEKSVLVTGAAGYIGSVLTASLLETGRRVVGYDLCLHGDESLQPVLENPDFRLIRADIRDLDDHRAVLEDVDAVVHLAAIVGDPACVADPDAARSVNLDATLKLFERVCEHDHIRRFIFVSTCSNYGKMQDVEFLDEDAALNPLSLYAETKVAVEQHILGADIRPSLCPTVLRFATAYGLSPRMRFDLTVNHFARDITLKKELEIYGENFWRPYCHTSDIARACMVTLDADESICCGQVFNVGATTENYTKKDIAELLLEMQPDADVRYVSRDEDPRDYKVSFEKVRTQLGFEVTRKVPDGLREVRQALADSVYSDPFDSRYQNV